MLGLHQKQKQILEFLLDQKEGATAGEIASFLGVTKTAAQEHIAKIEKLNYLTYEDKKGGVGRPKRRYLLSQEGQESFPRQYSWFSTILLEFLTQNIGSEAIRQIMKGLASNVAASLAPRLQNTKSTSDRLVKVVSILNELGFRSFLRPGFSKDSALINATNCIYHSVAKTRPELCEFDLQLITEATGGMSVKQVSCMAKGDAICSFCVQRL